MAIYALAKFAAYCLWCFLGLYLLSPTRTSPWNAVKYGALRWLLGLLFGVVAAVALGSISSESVTALYFGVYAPLRILEWGIIAALIHRSSSMQRSVFTSVRAWSWVLGGIVVSFATDFASPEGMAGRFCVGRCLC